MRPGTTRLLCSLSLLEPFGCLPYIGKEGNPSRDEGTIMANDRAGRPTADEPPAGSAVPFPAPLQPRFTLLYHFCRLQLPAITLEAATAQRHLQRTFDVFRAKPDTESSWQAYLDNLYPLDWFLCSACIEGIEYAWEALFAFARRAGPTAC
jgi:hypothetical protein